MNNIIIYSSSNNGIQVEVKFENESVWLSQQQMALLFNQTKQNISLHINNCFKEGELEKSSTVKKYLTVQSEGIRTVNRKIEYYNLDVIISVGYRVKSIQGTQFRQWATNHLKDFLIKGYSINQKRLNELSQIVSVIQQSGADNNLKVDEAKGLINVLSEYTKSYVLLNQFDSNSLSLDNLNENITYNIKYNEAKQAIAELKKLLIDSKDATILFGNEKDKSFEGILGNILQSFDGQYLYPSIEAQAAHLLYFIIKNHPFSDGNKRIGAFLFIWFIEKNKYRFQPNGKIKINENGLVALALLVAQSEPADKELLVNLIINLIKNL